MTKLIFRLSVTAVLVTALGAGVLSAQSAKATAQVNELITLGVVGGPLDLTDPVDVATLNAAFTTIMEKTIKTANAKDLFIDVAIECGMMTKTRIKTSGGIEDTETADAGVRVRVLVDGSPILPDHGRWLDDTGMFGGVTLAGTGVSMCRRFQKLSAKLQGILSCPAGAIIPDECSLTDEEIELMLSTLSSNSMNFIALDLTSGHHTVTVQAVGITHASSSDSAAAAVAGAGVVTIEEVRMIKDEDIIF